MVAQLVILQESSRVATVEFAELITSRPFYDSCVFGAIQAIDL
jgi:hypothetical protein